MHFLLEIKYFFVYIVYTKPLVPCLGGLRLWTFYNASRGVANICNI